MLLSEAQGQLYLTVTIPGDFDPRPGHGVPWIRLLSFSLALHRKWHDITSTTPSRSFAVHAPDAIVTSLRCCTSTECESVSRDVRTVAYLPGCQAPPPSDARGNLNIQEPAHLARRSCRHPIRRSSPQQPATQNKRTNPVTAAICTSSQPTAGPPQVTWHHWEMCRLVWAHVATYLPSHVSTDLT
jgi:hypothetical protein